MNVKWLLVVAAIASVAESVPVSKYGERAVEIPDIHLAKHQRNAIFEELVLDLLETLRAVLQFIDPFEHDHLSLNGEIIGLPDANLELTGIQVDNLSKFVINELSITLASVIPLRYRVILNGNIPSLDVSADKYDMSVVALGYTLWGHGSAKIFLKEPTLNINFLVGPRLTISGLFLQIHNPDIRFKLGGFESDLTGVFGNASISSFVNTFLKNFVPEFINEFYEPQITEFLNTTVVNIINDFLFDFDLTDMISPSLLAMEEGQAAGANALI